MSIYTANYTFTSKVLKRVSSLKKSVFLRTRRVKVVMLTEGHTADGEH